MESYPDLKYLVALSNFPKFGPVRIKKLKKNFSCFKDAFTASASDLIAAGIEENVVYEFLAAKTEIHPEKLMEEVTAENIEILTIDDSRYPKRLKEIYDPPQLLYCKGKLRNKDEFNLAIVGTRKFSDYGKRATEIIVGHLAENRITVTSGLAHGIDTLAHNATLKAGGRTIAVLGCGIDKKSIYPSANRYLADKIASSGGLVLSEFPLGTAPLRHHFPQRNRIISGLTLGTLVIEAGEKSGALITAQYALEQNREVFAVPGSIYSPVSIGPNNLIKAGAKAVTSGNDIMEALDLAQVHSYISSKEIIPESNEEKIVISHLSHEPIHIDELIRLTKMNTSLISSTLVVMEMKGIVKNLGSMQYVLAR